MTLLQLLEELALLDVELRYDAPKGFVHFTSPKGAVTPDLKDALREKKPEIIALLLTAGGSHEQVRGVATLLPVATANALDAAIRRRNVGAVT